jgi:hypothetical protein
MSGSFGLEREQRQATLANALSTRLGMLHLPRALGSISLLLIFAVLAACGDDTAKSAEGADGGDGSAEASGDTGAVDSGSGATDVTPQDGSGDTTEPLSPCNPLAEELDCLLPFPSDFFLQADATLPSGNRVVIPEPALPMPVRGRGPLDFSRTVTSDGFSPGSQILAMLPGAVDGSSLAGYAPQEPEKALRSLDADSPTVLVQVSNGRKVAHIAELDVRAPRPARQSLIIRPLERLLAGETYAVGISSLRDLSGAAIEPSPGFRTLRDGTPSEDARLQAAAASAESILFPALAAAGKERSSLQLAWTFTVGSDEQLRGDLLRIRGLAIEALRTAPPEITIDSVEFDTSARVARLIRGRITVPLFLESSELAAAVYRGADGRAAQNGTTEVPFVAVIPNSVVASGSPARLLQFGHGFFGNSDEATEGYVTEFADRFGFVVIAMNWWGMSTDDLPALIRDILNDTSLALRFTDRVHQAMINLMALAGARERLAALEPFRLDGNPLVDASEVYFQGISQGHILGGTYSAISPDVRHAVLTSGGANFSGLMFRARPFLGFLGIIAAAVPDALDQQKFATLAQFAFDRVDPYTYSAYLLGNDLDGSRFDRRVLMQMGVGDSEVPNLGSELHARAAGLQVLQPSPVATPPLMSDVEGSGADSAFAIYDFNVDPFPSVTPAPADVGNRVHNDLRGLTAAMRQLDAFFRPDGRVEQFCDGVCDPE